MEGESYRPVEHRILAFVRRSRELGFSLNDIRALLRLGSPDKASCREVREIAAHHLAEICAKIGDLRKLESLLATTVSQCSGTTAPECPVLDILDIGRTGSARDSGRKATHSTREDFAPRRSR
jgi:MerR family mercuric resistance operon transcriptional regulator